jgi:hypothetical protein
VHLVARIPFGDDPQAEVVRQIDRRSRSHQVLPGEEAGDEGAIDLQPVDRAAGADS